jgi:hypothetical protein
MAVRYAPDRRLNLVALTNSHAWKNTCLLSRCYVGVISLLKEIKSQL